MTHPPAGPAQPPADPDLLPTASGRETWAALRAEFGRHRGLTAVSCGLLLAAAAAGLVAPWVLGHLVDDVIGGADTGAIVTSALIIGGAALVAGALTAVGAAYVGRLGETILARLRERVLDRALHLSSATLERAGTGDLVARAGDDVAVVATALTSSGPTMVNAVLTVVLTGLGLFALDWRLGLAGLLAAPLYALALRWYLPRALPVYARERVVIGQRAQAMAGALRGSAPVRASRRAQQPAARSPARSAAARDLSLDAFAVYTRFASRLNRAEYVGLAAVLVAGFLLVRADLATVGAATAAALYFHRLFNPIGVLLLESDSALQAGAGLARLVGVASLPAPPPVREERTLRDTGLDVTVGVHRYDATGPVVLEDVRLRIGAGERVALVGASGAGKSTLAGIAAGVLEPTEGSVRLGGVLLTELGEQRVRRSIGLVTQEVHVFAGTLADDVRLAHPGATDDEVAAALRTAGADGWVAALPDGTATRVGEGAYALTAAQAQQLALARLVLADPPVAVLDEATAEAGSAGARDLDRAAVAVTAGRTTLVVAHRLTQAATADRIVVLDHGRVAEQGTHTDLLAAGGPYARLWQGWSTHLEKEPGYEHVADR